MISIALLSLTPPYSLSLSLSRSSRRRLVCSFSSLPSGSNNNNDVVVVDYDCCCCCCSCSVGSFSMVTVITQTNDMKLDIGPADCLPHLPDLPVETKQKRQHG